MDGYPNLAGFRPAGWQLHLDDPVIEVIFMYSGFLLGSATPSDVLSERVLL